MRTIAAVVALVGFLALPAGSSARGRDEAPGQNRAPSCHDDLLRGGTCPVDVEAAVATCCPCEDASGRWQHIRCVSNALRALSQAGCVDRSARRDTMRCAFRSTCGTDSAVTCCIERPGRCSDEGLCVGTELPIACATDAECPDRRHGTLTYSAERCLELDGVPGVGSSCDACVTTTTTSTTSTTTTTTSTTTTTIPVASVARGTITAPNGNPQINRNCGYEVVVAGSDYWTNGCWVQARGIFEFDLRSLQGRLANRVTLRLQDTGSTTARAPQSTNIMGYPADGFLTDTDWGAAAELLMTMTRPDVAGSSVHDVTTYVNDRLSAGDSFVGFRLEPADPATFDAFGFSGMLTFE